MKYLIPLFFLLSGCIHTISPVATTSDQYLAKASVISDRLDAKAVIVEQWLRTH
jgi:hypothetical protein